MSVITTNEIDRLAKRYSKSRTGLNEIEKLRLVQAIQRGNENPVAGTTPRHVPKGYMALAEFQNSLGNRMWAGFGSAELVVKMLSAAEETGKRRAGFGPRQDSVAAARTKPFRAGKLTLYIAADPARFDPLPSWAKDPMPVPKHLLGYVFIAVAGRMPGTFAIRPSRKVVGDGRLFAMIERGHLVVKKSEVTRWFRSERKKRRWPSQEKAQCARNPVGRPNKKAAELKAAILDIDRQQVWNGTRPLAALHRLLVERGLPVSVDTVGRVIGRIFAETGNPRLRRHRRVRRS